MPQLVNQFNLGPGVLREELEKAWTAFGAHLVAEGLAENIGKLFERRSESGYDTDAERQHKFHSVITFADQRQADVAWAEIEGGVEPLRSLHLDLISLVDDPIFTFWS